MPTYTYRCEWCRHEQDEFHGMSEKPRIRCEKCAHSCERLVDSGCGVIFKGSGFYQTDYKRKKEGGSR